MIVDRDVVFVPESDVERQPRRDLPVVLNESGIGARAVVIAGRERAARSTGGQSEQQIGERVPAGECSRSLSVKGIASAAVADHGSVGLEAEKIQTEFERVLAAHERNAVGELISVVEPLLREIGGFADSGEALNACLWDAGIGRSVESRAGNVELLGELDVLIVRDSRIAELRVADLELIDQIGIENMSFRKTGE